MLPYFSVPSCFIPLIDKLMIFHPHIEEFFCSSHKKAVVDGKVWSKMNRGDIQKAWFLKRQKDANADNLMTIAGWFFSLVPPKKLKYEKPRLGESTLT